MTGVVILGIGTDLVDIRRVEQSLKKFPQSFLPRISSPKDQMTTQNSLAILAAKRFCAKEACAKAFGVGIGRYLSFRDMTVVNGLNRPPEIRLAPDILPKIWPDLAHKKIKLDLSLSDEYPYVQAFVVVSRL